MEWQAKIKDQDAQPQSSHEVGRKYCFELKRSSEAEG